MNTGDLIIKPKFKGEDGYRVISIRVREETVARLDEVAGKSGRSRNEIVGMFLAYALDHCIVEEPDE